MSEHTRCTIPAVATGEANGAPGGGVTAADLAHVSLAVQHHRLRTAARASAIHGRPRGGGQDPHSRSTLLHFLDAPLHVPLPRSAIRRPHVAKVLGHFWALRLEDAQGCLQPQVLVDLWPPGCRLPPPLYAVQVRLNDACPSAWGRRAHLFNFCLHIEVHHLYRRRRGHGIACRHRVRHFGGRRRCGSSQLLWQRYCWRRWRRLGLLAVCAASRPLSCWLRS
mmetsp:Transcript_104696/g.249285  ORF Transcript_104696/g.249285 Transcript_104696/m.249285 type:complete len:222 (-) Transcript_104696:217-882(-)